MIQLSKSRVPGIVNERAHSSAEPVCQAPLQCRPCLARALLRKERSARLQADSVIPD